MKIETFILTNNEEKILPYTLRHYLTFSKVILLESNSTDDTVKIAKKAGAEIWNYDVPDEVNDEWFLQLKNNCWKESKADWVIICDTDEFVYHPKLVEILETTHSTIFLPRLFNMFSDTFPVTKGQIYDEVKFGKEGGGKMNLFKPSEIKEMNYDPGCHYAHPTGNVILNVNSEILTLHMRHLSIEYVNARNARNVMRMSEINKKNGWGYHCYATPETIDKYFSDEMTALLKVC
jgi:glycosyltransferase involved in cell wall biosynthesis